MDTSRKYVVFSRYADSRAVDNWSDEAAEEKSPMLDTSDAEERLSVCLQLADARQPAEHRAKIVRQHDHFVVQALR